ncbi:MAG: thermonuclease family protein [Coriobacteriia bacterium]|nr:thermonuclease family protein [Coriobacteriia bacterium]
MRRATRRELGLVLVTGILLFTVAFVAGCADATTLPDSGGGTPQGELNSGSSAEQTAPVDQAQTEPSEPAPAPPLNVPKTTRGVVTRVVDGDTAVITLANGASEKVRFIGINTPESTTQHEPYGEEASAYTKQMLSGQTVYLETDAELRDRYGRLLAYIWLQQPASDSDAEVRTSMFNARLVLDGYAEQATYPPNVKYVDLFAVYAREAREADRGLWGLSAMSAGAAASGGAAAGSSAGGGSGSSTGSASGYIGNRNTMKFHYPACSSVGEMNPTNKVPLATRAAAIAGGYVPCKRCNP